MEEDNAHDRKRIEEKSERAIVNITEYFEKKVASVR
jgi:hypothetical protein